MHKKLFDRFSSTSSEQIQKITMTNVRYPSSSQAKSKAVVLMFGWIGSTLKHLQKYADLYLKKDCAVVISCPPVTSLFQLEGPLRSHALSSIKETARILCEVELGSANHSAEIPVLIHYFSNGGAFIAEVLDRMIKEAKSESSTGLTKEDVENLLLVSKRLYSQGYEVVDSAPAYLGIDSARNAIHAAVPNTVIRIIIKTMLRISWHSTTALFFLQGKKAPDKQFWDRVLLTELCSRQAFIYSTADNVTDACKVDELVKERSARGVDIICSKFDDSPHVMHIRKHPNEYEAMVTRVLDKVFQNCVEDRSKL